MNKPLYKTIRRLLKHVNELLGLYLDNRPVKHRGNKNILKKDKTGVLGDDEMEKQLKKIKGNVVENIKSCSYKELDLVEGDERLKESEEYRKLKTKYDKFSLFDDYLVDTLIRSELYKMSSVVGKYKKDSVEKFFLKEISIKSSIILTLLFSFYDLSYLLCRRVEVGNLVEFDLAYGRL